MLSLVPDASLPSLRTVVVGGDTCPAELVSRWAPGRQFFNGYGPTEATVCMTVARCVPEEGKPSIGRPIANMQAYVLDTKFQLSRWEHRENCIWVAMDWHAATAIDRA